MSGLDMVLADALGVEFGLEGVYKCRLRLFYPEVWEGVELGHRCILVSITSHGAWPGVH